jgi:hypothetical protein
MLQKRKKMGVTRIRLACLVLVCLRRVWPPFALALSSDWDYEDVTTSQQEPKKVS